MHPPAADPHSLAAGMYLGLMATTALLNCVGWLGTHRRLHGLFALFVACSALRWAALDGLLGPFAAPHGRLADALLGAQTVTGSLCQIEFLQLRQGRFPWLRHYYLWCGVALGTAVMAAPWLGGFGVLSTLLFALLLPAPLLSMPAYARLWRSGELAQRLVAVALPAHFAVMLPAIMGNVAGSLGGMPQVLAWPLWLQAARWSGLPLVLTLHASIALQARAAARARDEAQHRAAVAQADAQRQRQARGEQHRFLSMLAHEVRTPVAVIDAAAHSLRLLDRMDGAPPAQRAERYQRIDQAVARMRTLMELAEAQDRLHEPEEPAGPLDLPALTTQALAALDAAGAARVAVSVAPGLPPLRGDARLLYFALLNLLDNALKYAHPATPIHIGIAAAPGGVAWHIRDHGPGIPEDRQHMIFDKYQRLDNGGDQPGLGMGLALARQIAERHGGRLDIDRAWTQGACFALWLPA